MRDLSVERRRRGVTRRRRGARRYAIAAATLTVSAEAPPQHPEAPGAAEPSRSVRPSASIGEAVLTVLQQLAA
ncbi:hypothetical protein [Microbacterium sp. SD291]|uniref:hypothetical protein n=1 Tax=Microbacterium sp. SD291 TaxID=2782007 RepID=UPI001A95A580|nr:hypothetical protein [Microbacterium sp. SD291]MBO0981510.1 hypothetical protein [Microbacterium sp. SD291]